jgi:hypothetical protein
VHAISYRLRRIVLEKRIILVSLVVLGVTGILGTPASAVQTRKSITPLLNLSAQHDNNFYKTATNEEGVWTYIIQPGLEAEIETERNYASVYYTLDAYYYRGLDEDLDFIGHTFKLDSGTRSRSDKLHISLKDTFLRTRDPAELDYLNNTVSTNEYSINRFDPEVLYNFGRASVRLAYGNVWIDYVQSGGGEDSTENRGTAEWKYRFNRANALGLNYQYWNTDYDGPTSDYDSQQAKVIVERQGKMLLLEAGAGWQSREFDEGPLDDISRFVWDFMLRTKGLKNTELIFRADSNYNNWSSGSGYFDATKLAFTVNHDFVADLQGRLYGSYQKSDYEYSDRDDDTMSFEASLAYTLTRWLTVSGAVGTESRDSNLDAADYDNVYGFAMFSFVYPVGTGSPVISPSPYSR